MIGQNLSSSIRSTPYLVSMLLIVQSQASDRPDVLEGKGRQQQPYVGYLVRHFMLAKDVAGQDARLLGLCNVRHAAGQNGIAIVYLAVLGEKANEALSGMVSLKSGEVRVGGSLTEKEGMAS